MYGAANPRGHRLTTSLGQARGGRWPTPRVVGAILQCAALALIVVGRTTVETLMVAVALALAGRGVRISRSLSRERMTTTLKYALGAATALVAIALTARVADHGRFDSQADRTAPFALAVVGIVALGHIVAPRREDAEPDINERHRIGLLAGGPDSDLMAPFTLGHGKRYVTSPDGTAAIGHRVIYGVSVAGPGPIGSPAAHSAALHAWLDRCDEHGWRPAMIGADTAVRALARPMGLRGVCIGDEVIAEVAPFRLDTPPMRGVRQAVQRTRNAGVEVTMLRERQLHPAERAELADVAVEWQHGHGARGFAMTLDHLLDHTHPDAVIAIAHHRGRVVGFQRYFECRGGTGLTLDVMPRRSDAPNGTNERMIVEAIDWARTRGITELSLNFAAFRTLFEAEPTHPRRALRRVVHLLDRFLNVESLYRFNAKFRPTWNARHVLFRYPLDVPFVLAAALRLEFGPRRRLDRPAVAALGAAEQA
jgi:lysyl-tRNA synthetase class 2